MEKRTPNKRKSLANSNTPNKIRKTDTPVPQKVINKSPKSANKNNQLSTNGKKSKSPNKNYSITPKKQANGNQATPKKQINAKQTTPKKQINAKQTTPKKQINAKQATPKGNKKSKQEEEDDVESMDDDNSVNESNDSDVEEAEVDEADSDEDAQVDEDESGDELQVDEEEEAESDDDEDEVELDEKAQVDEDESGDEVEDEEADIDEEEDDDDELENDEETDKEGNGQDGTETQDTNKLESGMSVLVKHLKPGVTVDRIFPGCNIKYFKKWRNPDRDSEDGEVCFKDQESLKKALAKTTVDVDGNIIRVEGNEATRKYGVFLKYKKIVARHLFNDCNILWFDAPWVYFEDKESMQKALLKNGTEFNGKFMTVLPTIPVQDKEIHLSINIYGLNSDAKIEDIFEECNINFYFYRTETGTNQWKSVTIIFEDEESVQKALLKHDTEYNGSVIKLYRRNCTVFVSGIKENTNVETILTGCNIHKVDLKMNKFTNELKGAVVCFKDFSSVGKALSMKTPPGITVTETSNTLLRNKSGDKSGFVKNKFNRRPYQQTHRNEAKKLLLQELKSQVQKLTEEVYGTSKPRPKPFMKNNTFGRRNPRINN